MHYLVMEHLEGQTLAQRLRAGALPVAQALDVGAQIADALAAAHRHGIVHRDLKPGNIMLVRHGGGLQAKLLDFGLAKLSPRAGGSEDGESTHSAAALATSPGTLMGTVPYMAPEQLEGKATDARTDLFAFGCVLYEMLTGQRAFAGDSEASLVSAIMTSEPPPITTLQPLTPPALDRLVRGCLAKDPDARRESAHDLAEDLRSIRAAAEVSSPESAQGRPRRRWVIGLVVLGVLGAVVAGAALMSWVSSGALHGPVVRLDLNIRPAEEVNSGGVLAWTAGGSTTAVTWTPDGRALVFVGRRGGVQQLYLRPLDAAEARPLAGTDGARVPAVSPDGQWVAFWADGALKKVPITGGPAVQLASGIDTAPFGLAWDNRGTLYFGAEGDTIDKVDAGGTPTHVTTRGETETWHGLPSLLPGGRYLLYTAGSQDFSSGDEVIIAQSIENGQRTVVLHHATDARYVPSGHLVFMREGALMAIPFDLATLKVHGDVVPMLGGVAHAIGMGDTRDFSRAGQFAVSSTGSLAWIAGEVTPPQDRALVEVDRRGHVTPLAAPVKPYGHRVRLSPDGGTLVINVSGLHETTLWTYDLARGILTPTKQETGEATYPAWTPDGRHVAFSWNLNGRHSLAWLRGDGTGAVESLVTPRVIASSWTPDGRHLAGVDSLKYQPRLVALDQGRASAVPFPDVPETAWYLEFSPDGQWLAYASLDADRRQVYVQRDPGPGPRVPVSIARSSAPAWRWDGRALFFLARTEPPVPGRINMMEVDFEPGVPPRLGTPRKLFDINLNDLFFLTVVTRGYDVSPDGQRFFVVQRRSAPPNARATQVNLVLNWFEELKAKVPATR